MSGKKGMGHRNWTKAEKLSYVLRHLEEHVALKEVARESVKNSSLGNSHRNSQIIRSMSRVATPTDNPINESLNGWIKQELYLDFGLANAEDVPKLINDYVRYFNSTRLAYSLNYKTPKLYKQEMGF